MKSDIILVDTKTVSELGARSLKAFPNLSLTYLMDYLNKKNYRFKIVDLTYDTLDKKDLENSRFIGVSSMTHNILETYAIFEKAKTLSKEIITVLGGAHGTALPQETLMQCEAIDIVVMGEGEEAIAGLLADEPLNTINNIAYRENGEIKVNPFKRISNEIFLNANPYLDFEGFKRYSLVEYSRFYQKGVVTMPVLCAKGCVNKCTFCRTGDLRKRILFRDPEDIINQIELYREKYGAQRINILDSLLIPKTPLFQSLSDYFKREKISWAFQTHPKLVNELLLESIEGTMVEVMFLGIESCDDGVLQKMKKGSTWEDIGKAVKLLKNKNIKVGGNLILGSLGETQESMARSFERFRTLNLDSSNINVMQVYPGTTLWDEIENNDSGWHWVENARGDWENYNRSKPQIESAELSAGEIEKYRDEYKRKNYTLEKKIRKRIRKKLIKSKMLYSMTKKLYFSIKKIFSSSTIQD